MFKDYYSILEIRSDASLMEIRNAFKKLAFRWHPDRNNGIDTTSKMQDINEAYLILKDNEARKKYDEEYQRYKLHCQQMVNHVSDDKKTDSHTTFTQTETSYNVQDDVLFRWMKNAREQAVNLTKETLEDLMGMTKVGIKEASKNALFAIIFGPVLILVLFFIFSIPNCNGEREQTAMIDTIKVNNTLTFHQQLDIYRNIFHIVPDTAFQIDEKHILYSHMENNQDEGVSRECYLYLTLLKNINDKWTLDYRFIADTTYNGRIDSLQIISVNDKKYLYYQNYFPGGSWGNYDLLFVVHDIFSKEKYYYSFCYFPDIIPQVGIHKSSNLIKNTLIKNYLDKKFDESDKAYEQSYYDRRRWPEKQFYTHNDLQIDSLLYTSKKFITFKQIRAKTIIDDLQTSSDVSTEMKIENENFIIYSIFRGSLWAYDKHTEEYICLWAPQNLYEWVTQIIFDEDNNVIFSDHVDNQILINIDKSLYQRLSPAKVRSNWERYVIPKKFQIDIPPTMEVQSGNYEYKNYSCYQAVDTSQSNFVFQQQGLYEDILEAHHKYARIICDIEKNIIKKIIDVDSMIMQIHRTKLTQLNTEIKSNLRKYFNSVNNNLIRWDDAKFIVINDMTCINYNFVRQAQNRPEIYVQYFIFEKNRTRYTITMSYRLDKESLYKDDFQKVINSFVLLDSN